MRCLSIRQPFAWAVCAGLKTVENRVWSTGFRGTIAIHASTSTQYVNSLRKSTGIAAYSIENFALGAIVGLADIVDVQPYGQVHEANSHATGPYCFTVANAKLFETPIPMNGKLNLFQLDRTIEALVQNARQQTIDFSPGTLAAEITRGLEFVSDVVENYRQLIEELWEKQEVSAIRFAAARLIELEPNNAYGYFARYMFSDQDQPLEQNLHDAQRMLDLEPDSAMAHACIGWTLHELDRNPEALKHLDRSLSLSEAIPRAWYSRSEIHLALKNFKNAFQDSNRALQDEPQLLDALLVSARASLALGNRSQAKQDAEKILSIFPDSPDAQEILKSLD